MDRGESGEQEHLIMLWLGQERLEQYDSENIKLTNILATMINTEDFLLYLFSLFTFYCIHVLSIDKL